MPVAYLFPGQGAQFPGMGRELYEKSALAKEVFDRADSALGRSLSGLCFGDDPEPLKLTENQQPSVLTVALASLVHFQKDNPDLPQLAAGHSLGEYSALVCAGALELEDAVRLVELRGRLMQEAVPAGEGAMAAVLMLERQKVEEVCLAMQSEGHEVWAANHNGGKQTVISGRAEAVSLAHERLKEAGARRVLMLNVSGPFHTPLMEKAANRLREALEKISWKPLRFPVISNVDANAYQGPEEIVGKLTAQLTSPVLWEDSVRTMEHAGITHAVEFMPGKVLSGMVRRISPSINCTQV